MRWTSRRKAELVRKVQMGLTTLEQIQIDYAVSLEEFIEWTLRLHNNQSLKATHRVKVLA